MLHKVYAYLFILCTIFIQGIAATFLKEDVEEPSKLFVRKKRVINRILGEDVPIDIKVAPYIVNIKVNNHMHCVGSILSHRTVITAARCIVLELFRYTVISGSTYAYLGMDHNVTEKRTHISARASGVFGSGIALLTVYPPFEYGRNTRQIDLHVAPVLGGMDATITGWGSYLGLRRAETAHTRKLRSVTVPILNHRDCVNYYREHMQITDTEICTFHEKKKCGVTDAGAPLTIDNLLVGVFFGGLEPKGKICDESPDIFAFVQHLDYSRWILRNIVH